MVAAGESVPGCKNATTKNQEKIFLKRHSLSPRISKVIYFRLICFRTKWNDNLVSTRYVICPRPPQKTTLLTILAKTIHLDLGATKYDISNDINAFLNMSPVVSKLCRALSVDIWKITTSSRSFIMREIRYLLSV